MGHFSVFIQTWKVFKFINGASLIVQLLKNPSAMQEILVLFLGWEDPLKKGKSTHSSILAWRINEYM